MFIGGDIFRYQKGLALGFWLVTREKVYYLGKRSQKSSTIQIESNYLYSLFLVITNISENNEKNEYCDFFFLARLK